MSHRIRAALIFLLVYGFALPVLAKKPRRLIAQAHALMAEERFIDACEKFEAAVEALEKNDANTAAAKFDLADCQEQLGNTASAWELYRDAATEFRRAGQKVGSEDALKRARAVKKRLTRIRLLVQEPVSNMKIRFDDTAIPRANWGNPYPINPGTYKFRADAPGHQYWTRVVAATEEGTTVDLFVPALTPVPSDDYVPLRRPQDVDDEPAPVSLPEEPSGSPPTATYVLGGIGLVGLSVGAVFGLQFLDFNQQAKDTCVTGFCTPQQAAIKRQHLSDARSARAAGFIAAGVGLAATGLGTYFWVNQDGDGAGVVLRGGL